MKKTFLLNHVRHLDRITIDASSIDKASSPGFIVQLLEKLDMTPQLFADSIGVSLETVEAWMSGEEYPSGPSARLLVVLDKHPAVIDDIYHIS